MAVFLKPREYSRFSFQGNARLKNPFASLGTGFLKNSAELPVARLEDFEVFQPAFFALAPCGFRMERKAASEKFFRKIQESRFVERRRGICLELPSVRVGTHMAIAPSEIVEIGVLDDFFQKVARPRENDGCQYDTPNPNDPLFGISEAAEEVFRVVGSNGFVLRVR